VPLRLGEALARRLDLGFGADALMLSALAAEPLGARQAELHGDARLAGDEALASLIDRLQARLGEGAVLRPQGVQSHLPERSERWVAAGPAPLATLFTQR